jgi:glycosyltransferase involved in cell wall biosynthesis
VATRVCLLQPVVPLYRVPVFEALARVPGIELEVWADLRRPLGSIAGVRESDTFTLRHASYSVRAGVVLQPSAIRAVRSGFDVVIMTDNVRSPAMFAALALRKCPVILWGHGFGTHHDRLGHRLRLLSFGAADAGLFYGAAGRQRFIDAGLDRVRLFVAPNAIDQAPIERARAEWHDPARLDAFRRKVGLGAGPLLLYLARLEPEKLPHLAVDALLQLRQRHPGVQLALIGGGRERESLLERARREGLESHVHLPGALYEESAIAPWAMSASLLIHPGAIGLSILHAFGYGLPVITSNNQTIQMPEFECLKPGQNGLTYRHGDLRDLVMCCDRVLTDPMLHERISRGAMETVRPPDGRTVDGMVRGFLEAVRYVTGQRVR